MIIKSPNVVKSFEKLEKDGESAVSKSNIDDLLWGLCHQSTNISILASLPRSNSTSEKFRIFAVEVFTMKNV